MFGWLKPKPRDPFVNVAMGVAQVVGGIRELQPRWERVEIVRTADGVTWGVSPNIPGDK